MCGQCRAHTLLKVNPFQSFALIFAAASACVAPAGTFAALRMAEQSSILCICCVLG